MVKLNGKKIEKYEEEYAQNALEFCNKHNISVVIDFEKEELSKNVWKESSFSNYNYINTYLVTIRRKGKSMRIHFHDSIYNYEHNIEPTVYDILACLTKYDPYGFTTFCMDFGYDEDSRTAYETYLAVTNEWEQVERVFGDILDELREIE